MRRRRAGAPGGALRAGRPGQRHVVGLYETDPRRAPVSRALRVPLGARIPRRARDPDGQGAPHCAPAPVRAPAPEHRAPSVDGPARPVPLRPSGPTPEPTRLPGDRSRAGPRRRRPDRGGGQGVRVLRLLRRRRSAGGDERPARGPSWGPDHDPDPVGGGGSGTTTRGVPASGTFGAGPSSPSSPGPWSMPPGRGPRASPRACST